MEQSSFSRKCVSFVTLIAIFGSQFSFFGNNIVAAAANDKAILAFSFVLVPPVI